MSEHGLKTYEHYRVASQQFDYFLTGLNGALCAYIIQHLQPQKISFSPYTLELIALFTLIGSLVISLKTIETTIELLKINHIRLDKGDTLSKLTSLLAEGGSGPVLLTHDGKSEVVGPEAVARKAQTLQVEVEALKEIEEDLMTRGGKGYRWRSRLLILGFILLAASKIIEPYFIKPQ
jgi:hypothetical protein